MSDIEYMDGFDIKFSGETTVELAVDINAAKKLVVVHYRVGLAGPEWMDYALFDRETDGEYGIICTVVYPYQDMGGDGKMLDGFCQMVVHGHGSSNYETPFEVAKRLARMFGTEPGAVADATERAIQAFTGYDTYEMYAGQY